jgi:hypothetical protein
VYEGACTNEKQWSGAFMRHADAFTQLILG